MCSVGGFCVSVIRLCLIIVADWTLSGWQWCWPTNRSFCIYLLNMLVGIRSQRIETFYYIYTRILVFSVMSPRSDPPTPPQPYHWKQSTSSRRGGWQREKPRTSFQKKRCQRDENERAAMARARFSSENGCCAHGRCRRYTENITNQHINKVSAVYWGNSSSSTYFNAGVWMYAWRKQAILPLNSMDFHCVWYSLFWRVGTAEL